MQTVMTVMRRVMRVSTAGTATATVGVPTSVASVTVTRVTVLMIGCVDAAVTNTPKWWLRVCDKFCVTVTVSEKCTEMRTAAWKIVFTITMQSTSPTCLLKDDILSDSEIIRKLVEIRRSCRHYLQVYFWDTPVLFRFNCDATPSLKSLNLCNTLLWHFCC